VPLPADSQHVGSIPTPAASLVVRQFLLPTAYFFQRNVSDGYTREFEYSMTTREVTRLSTRVARYCFVVHLLSGRSVYAMFYFIHVDASCILQRWI